MKRFTSALIAASFAVSFASFARADDFPAAPMNAGAPSFPTVNGLAQQMLPGQAAPQPTAEPMTKPMRHRHMRHHAAKKAMMKKEM